MANIAKRPNGKWRARYRDGAGKEHSRHFSKKSEAQDWLDGVTTSVRTGTYVDPKNAKTTVDQWCEQWLDGYSVHRASTVRQARTHIAQITTEFGTLPLSAVRPSAVKGWTAKLKAAGHADSYVYALHNRLKQILDDAAHDGLIARNPCSRRTAPPMGKQKPYVATTEQIWALHDAMPDHLRVAVLVGAFAGLRIAEVSALRVADVDFVRGIVHPVQQWPNDPLKTKGSDAEIPIPRELTLLLSASVQQWPGEYLLTDGAGGRVGPWVIERAVRDVKANAADDASDVDLSGLPEEFSFHDLRHYLASLLISKGADIKTVQARLRHASAKTTLDTYAHLWPDADESTRTAIGEVIAARADSLRTEAAQNA